MNFGYALRPSPEGLPEEQRNREEKSRGMYQ